MPDLRVIEGGRGEVPRVVSPEERFETLRERVEDYIETMRLDVPREARPAFAAQAERLAVELEVLGELLGVHRAERASNP